MFEEKIFLNALSKKQARKLDWNNHINELFSENIISYTPQQIILIKDLLYSHLPSKYRKDFWFIASGAKREMLNNPGYYLSLLNNFPNGTQSPGERIVKLDINRTFPYLEYFKIEENKNKLLRILTAFIRRNSTIGYSQGFNFIVARLLMVVENEEKVFWIFTQIIEAYLPGDFFLLFSGVRKDMKIIEKMIKKKLTFFDSNIEICMSNLISKCFISLFSQIIPEKILYIIWDAFFIYGEIVLYRTFIWIAFLHYDKSLINHDLEDINKIVIEKMIKKKLTFFDSNIEICMSNLISKCFISLFSQIIPEKILYIIWDAFFIYGEIVLYRTFIWIAFLHYDKSLINHDLEDINKIVIEKMKNTKDINSLFYFLYLDDSVNKNKIRQWRKRTEEKTQSETIPNWSVDENIKCDRTMPYCLFNKEENNIAKNKHFVVHKTNHEINIINNYFFDKMDNDNKNNIKEIKEEKKENENLNDNIIIQNEIINDLNISADSLLIERQKHICPENK